MPVTSLEKIVAGLGARRASGAGLPTTAKDLGELASRASGGGKTFAKIAERLSADIAGKRAEADARMAEYRVSGDGTVRSKQALAAYKKALDEELTTHRRAVLAKSDEERTNALRELQELRETVSASRDSVFTSSS